MTRFRVEPLTNDLYKKFYDGINKCIIEDDILIQGDEENEAIFALAEGLALMDGEIPVSIAGVFFDDANIYAASDNKLKANKKTIFKFALEAAKIVKKYNAIILADKDIVNSSKFLDKLGFLKISEGLYKCPLC